MNNACEMGFGPHLVLDMFGCDHGVLFDLDKIYKLLDELPVIIGMHKIAPPYVFMQKGNPDTFDKGGVSGFVLIAESHISIHTFPGNDGHVFIDIFSCKQFNIEETVKYSKAFFSAKKVSKKVFDRGKEFPKDVNLALPIVKDERSEHQP